jgi:hypothetical protein
MNVFWLHNNIFWPGREWPYKKMKPRLIAEEKMKAGTNDFKFFCFNASARPVKGARKRTKHRQLS